MSTTPFLNQQMMGGLDREDRLEEDVRRRHPRIFDGTASEEEIAAATTSDPRLSEFLGNLGTPKPQQPSMGVPTAQPQPTPAPDISQPPRDIALSPFMSGEDIDISGPRDISSPWEVTKGLWDIGTAAYQYPGGLGRAGLQSLAEKAGVPGVGERPEDLGPMGYLSPRNLLRGGFRPGSSVLPAIAQQMLTTPRPDQPSLGLEDVVEHQRGLGFLDQLVSELPLDLLTGGIPRVGRFAGKFIDPAVDLTSTGRDFVREGMDQFAGRGGALGQDFLGIREGAQNVGEAIGTAIRGARESGPALKMAAAQGLLAPIMPGIQAGTPGGVPRRVGPRPELASELDNLRASVDNRAMEDDPRLLQTPGGDFALVRAKNSLRRYVDNADADEFEDLSELDSRLEAFDDIQRGDYERGADGAEEFQYEREGAWEEILDALDELEIKAADDIVDAPLSIADEVVAPRFVTSSKPRYRNATPEFESQLDKALYIVAKSGTLSAKDEDFMKFAMDATGLSRTEVRAAGQEIRLAMKGMYDEGSDTFTVPRQYDAPPVTPDTRIEALSSKPLNQLTPQERVEVLSANPELRGRFAQELPSEEFLALVRAQADVAEAGVKELGTVPPTPATPGVRDTLTGLNPEQQAIGMRRIVPDEPSPAALTPEQQTGLDVIGFDDVVEQAGIPPQVQSLDTASRSIDNLIRGWDEAGGSLDEYLATGAGADDIASIRGAVDSLAEGRTGGVSGAKQQIRQTSEGSRDIGKTSEILENVSPTAAAPVRKNLHPRTSKLLREHYGESDYNTRLALGEFHNEAGSPLRIADARVKIADEARPTAVPAPEVVPMDEASQMARGLAGETAGPSTRSPEAFTAGAREAVPTRISGLFDEVGGAEEFGRSGFTGVRTGEDIVGRQRQSDTLWIVARKSEAEPDSIVLRSYENTPENVALIKDLVDVRGVARRIGPGMRVKSREIRSLDDLEYMDESGKIVPGARTKPGDDAEIVIQEAMGLSRQLSGMPETGAVRYGDVRRGFGFSEWDESRRGGTGSGTGMRSGGNIAEQQVGVSGALPDSSAPVPTPGSMPDNARISSAEVLPEGVVDDVADDASDWPQRVKAESQAELSAENSARALMESRIASRGGDQEDLVTSITGSADGGGRPPTDPNTGISDLDPEKGLTGSDIKPPWKDWREWMNLPRSLLATGEISFVLRQGAILATSHPLTWGKAVKTTFRSLWDEAASSNISQAQRNSTAYKRFVLGHTPDADLISARNELELIITRAREVDTGDLVFGYGPKRSANARYSGEVYDPEEALQQAHLMALNHEDKVGDGVVFVFTRSDWERRDPNIGSVPFKSVDVRKKHPGALYFAEQGGEFSKREEVFSNRLAQHIPGIGKLIKGSERQYVNFLNQLRLDVMNDVVTNWEKTGHLATETELYKLAKFINHATGRGDLGKLEAIAPELTAVFFAPRLAVSRPQLIWDLISSARPGGASNRVRREFAKNLASFVGVGAGVMALLGLAGAKVGMNPRGSDFGKVRLGQTSYDFWAGYSQWAKLGMQIATGETVSPTGRIQDKPIGKAVGRFIESKLSPVAGFAWEMRSLRRGEQPVDFLGNPLLKMPTTSEEVFTKTVPSALTTVVKKMTPLFYQDLVDAFMVEGYVGIPKALPGAAGVGTATYNTRQEAIQKKGEEELGVEDSVWPFEEKEIAATIRKDSGREPTEYGRRIGELNEQEQDLYAELVNPRFTDQHVRNRFYNIRNEYRSKRSEATYNLIGADQPTDIVAIEDPLKRALAEMHWFYENTSPAMFGTTDFDRAFRQWEARWRKAGALDYIRANTNMVDIPTNLLRRLPMSFRQRYNQSVQARKRREATYTR